MLGAQHDREEEGSYLRIIRGGGDGEHKARGVFSESRGAYVSSLVVARATHFRQVGAVDGMDLGGLPPELTASGVSAGRLAPGTRLGPYRIEGLLGQGGMGAVYAALHLDLQRPVALKTLLDPQAGEEERARFVAEARALAKIDHPNVVRVLDVDTLDDAFGIVTRQPKGAITLESLLQRVRRLKLSEALRITREIARGLTALHAAKVPPRGAAQDRRQHEVGLELLDLRHAVDEGAVGPHHARRQLRIDRVEDHLRLRHLRRRRIGAPLGAGRHVGS